MEAQPEGKCVIVRLEGTNKDLGIEIIKSTNYDVVSVDGLREGSFHTEQMLQYGTQVGAIVSADGTGSAENKEKLLAEAGVHIAENTANIVEILKQIL